MFINFVINDVPKYLSSYYFNKQKKSEVILDSCII